MFNDNNEKQNPCRRRRSNSLDSKNHRIKIPDSNNVILKASSSNNILVNLNTFEKSLFIYWYKNRKSLKGTLSQIQDKTFRTGFPVIDNKCPQIIFLLSNLLKVENDYEIYTINYYDERLSEFLKWTEKEKKELFDEYNKGYKEMNQKIIEISRLYYDEDNSKALDQVSETYRRYSETMGLMVFNKSHQISTFLPNKSSTSFDLINKISEVNITDPTKKTDKSFKHVIVSKDVILIFANKKTERLKYKFLLKHLYCEFCNDSHIPHIESSLRIGGPFGDDLIITFNDPLCKAEWYNEIKNSILIQLECFKDQTTDVTIWKNLELNSSAPLDSKIFNINYKTTGLEMKKKAIEGFNQNVKNAGDFILTFNLTGCNRENILHDDVIVMALQEHIGRFGEINSCSEFCNNSGDKVHLSRTPFYLKHNIKAKKTKPNIDSKTPKMKPYILNERWSDNTMPGWLLTLLSDIYHEGSNCEGIFRKSSLKSKSDDIIQMICEGADDIEVKENIHTKANILKKFLSVIDGSIFTFDNKEKMITFGNEFTSFVDLNKNKDQINKILNIIECLPINNKKFLQMLLIVFDQITKNEIINKMSQSSLSASLAPSILSEMNKSSPEDFLKINALFECILSLVDRIVDEPSKEKIITMFNNRRPSTESTGIISAEELTNDLNNGSTIRRKDFMDSDPTLFNTNKLQQKKSVLQDMRNSYSEELPFDQTDSTFEPLKLSPYQNVRSVILSNKIPFQFSNIKTATEADAKTVELTSISPFRRQPQVNRKYRNNSFSNCKIATEDQSCTDLVQEIPKVEERGRCRKFIRNPEKTIYDRDSRSRDRANLVKSSPKHDKPNDVFIFNSHVEQESKNGHITNEPTDIIITRKLTKHNNVATKTQNQTRHIEEFSHKFYCTPSEKVSFPKKPLLLQRSRTVDITLQDDVKKEEESEVF